MSSNHCEGSMINAGVFPQGIAGRRRMTTRRFRYAGSNGV